MMHTEAHFHFSDEKEKKKEINIGRHFSAVMQTSSSLGAQATSFPCCILCIEMIILSVYLLSILKLFCLKTVDISSD
uniref:Uncharacterized protein n=1 Tax=Nelumbo nucifera TaxID=4432 RepID=A0A822YC74_NELNU|nr:TPA_asm: hypothetical protein HUJ06_030073 [Nelumbo nucifera]